MKLITTKQKCILVIGLFLLVGLLMPMSMGQPPYGSASNTHKFKNTSENHYDDLHVDYTQLVNDPDTPPEFKTEGGATVEGWEAQLKTLTVFGSFPPGSTVTITAYAKKKVMPVKYYWTLGGQQVGPTIPVKYVSKWISSKTTGKFEYSTTVNKPVADVRVDVKGAVNIKDGVAGVKVELVDKNGKTQVKFSGELKDKSKKGAISALIDPPDEILDLVVEMELAAEIKGFFGVKASITNIGNETAENLTWSVDLSGFVFIGNHADGIIASLVSGATIDVGPPLVFGIGPSTISVAIGNATVNATGFVLGPFVLGIKEIL